MPSLAGHPNTHEVSIRRLLADRTDKFPDAPAILALQLTPLTYAGLCRQVEGIAAWLAAAGVQDQEAHHTATWTRDRLGLSNVRGSVSENPAAGNVGIEPGKFRRVQSNRRKPLWATGPLSCCFTVPAASAPARMPNTSSMAMS